jgi:hypothetical protein
MELASISGLEREKESQYIIYVACPRSSCSRLEEEWDVNWWHTPPALLTLQDPVDFQ